VVAIAQPPFSIDLRASFSAIAHSSQQTSTVLPPIVTLIALSSSGQSQAAHVFSFMVNSVVAVGRSDQDAEELDYSAVGIFSDFFLSFRD
jgi:hypothetical protein